nr:MAG TPA: hypothetical protein [Caudoviricetes sp.]
MYNKFLKTKLLCAVNLIVISYSLLHFFESLLLCSGFCSRK